MIGEPLISVIIPVYNSQDYLPECIMSVVSQDIDDMEIIAVDDGSSDSSLGILQSYSERYPNLHIFSSRRLGASGARNIGLDQAMGKYVVFLDSDDMLLPGALKGLYHAILEEKTRISVGQTLRKYPGKLSAKTPEIESFSSCKAITRLLYQTPSSFVGGVWGKMFDRMLFRDIRFKENILFEDIEILPQLYLEARSVAYLHRPVYFYRRNPQSTLETCGPPRADILKVLATLRKNPLIGKNASIAKALDDRELSAAFNILLSKDYRIFDKQTLAECVEIIRKKRNTTMFNSCTRFKNKCGALLSYLGPQALVLANRLLKIVR